MDSNESNLLAGAALAAIIGIAVVVGGSLNLDSTPLVDPAPVIPNPPPVPIPPPIPKPPPCPGPGPCPRAADDAGYLPVGQGGYEKCECCLGCKCDKDSCPCKNRTGYCGAFACHCNRLEESFGATVDGETHNGVEVQLPLPPDFHTKNVGGTDGAGLCVFDSMHHSGIWCDEPVFAAIFDYMKNHPGGGYPDKVAKMVKQCAKEMGLPEPDYIQVTGKDLGILKEACRLGRMPGVTYSRSPTGRYNGRRISHMVNLVHADDNWFVVLDNNYVTGEKHLEWMSPDEFLKTYSPGWAVIPLKAGPPFPPSN